MRYTPLILLLFTVLVAILSWLGSVYDWGLHSLLDAEGLRWMLTHVLENLRLSPWAEVAMGLCTLSILTESGLPQVFLPRFWRKSRRSLKKLRALQVTAVCFVLFVLGILYFALVPSSPLLSALGRFSQSPLYFGLYPLIAMMLILLSVIYGYTSGRFLSFTDVVQALLYLPASIADYFLTLFMASQFVACFHYMLAAPQPTLGQLLTDEALPSGSLPVWAELLLFIVVYGIPLLSSILRIYVKR